MAVMTSTGTHIYLSADVPFTYDLAGYDALSYTEVGEVTSIPEFGANAQVVTHDPLATGVTEKHKGFINYGSMSIEAAYDDSDGGQGAAEIGVVGANKNLTHSFKLVYQDGSIRFWTGKLFSYTENPSAANSMVGTTIQLEINSVILKVGSRPEPIANKVAVIGTSLVNQCEYGNTNVLARSQQGWITWMMGYNEKIDCPIWYDDTVLTGWEPNGTPSTTRYFQGLNFGVSGQTAQQIYDRRYDIGQMNADIFVLDMGTNDIASQTAEYVHGLRLQMVQYLETLNPRWIVVLPILMRGAGAWAGGGAEWLKAQEVNRLTQEVIGIREKVRVYNWNNRWSDQDSIYGYPRAGASNDDTHFDGRGAKWVGEDFEFWMRPLLTDVLPEQPRENLLPSGDFAGTLGNNVAPVTGDVATDYECSRQSGDAVVACSKNGSDEQVITITPQGTAGTSLIYFLTNTATTPHVKSGLWGQSSLEYSIQDPDCLQEFYLYFREYTGGTGGQEVGNADQRAATNYTLDDVTQKVRTPFLKFSDTSDGFRWRINITVDNTSTTPVVITLKDVWVSEMNDPITTYGQIVQD